METGERSRDERVQDDVTAGSPEGTAACQTRRLRSPVGSVRTEGG
jgi:hypothetical protein